MQYTFCTAHPEHPDRTSQNVHKKTAVGNTPNLGNI
jgi:hypothetical protein